MNKISPNWLVPERVKGFTTTRQGGVSQAPFESFNLGMHVGDSESAVKTNRTLLVERFNLPQSPVFLHQVHSTKVVRLPQEAHILEADAAYTNQPNQVCVVMTADCLPVLFTNQQGNEVAAAHAGWRGLCDGILEQTVAQFQCPSSEIMAWFGPAISKRAFQVGQEVKAQFIQHDSQAKQAFTPDLSAVKNEKYFADLYLLARQRLNALGIKQIYGGEHCTFNERELFFSYRREGKTGRMASLIWFE